MNCDQFLDIVDAYLDKELDTLTQRDAESHLATCPECRERVRLDEKVGISLRQDLGYAEVSPNLSERIRKQTVGQRQRLPLALWSVASSLAGAFLVLLVLRPWAHSSSAVQELVSDHLRALLATNPYDVESSDRHTVKPWFQGKATLSPAVIDLREEGFPLKGGRMDVLHGKPVPTLVFKKDKHWISVFVTDQKIDLGGNGMIRGFLVKEFSRGNLEYIAVSDVNQNELDRFVQLYTQAP